jgi:pimeloyl-ACP methyl ester carboxylesterase
MASDPGDAWSGFCYAAGHRLEVTRTGGRSPTLVFLHEGLGSVSAWRDFPRRLAAATGCATVVYSRWGYGQSDPVVRPRPLRFMHDEALRALPELLAELSIDDAVLIGHSDGASIALIYAGALGARVRGLVLEAPHVFVEDLCVRAITRIRADYQRTDLAARLGRHHADPDGAFYGWADAWLDPDFATSFHLEPYLPGVRVPSLIVQGEDDEYGTLAQVDAICQNVQGRCERLILPACGHAPHRDCAAEVLAAMTRFVATIEQAPPYAG